jgi:multidrug efflux system membrane fusion protein
MGQGVVLLINNQIDLTTGTVQLKATFPNQDHALWPGQFIAAQLLVETRHGAVTVPAGAVQRGPDGVFAYVVKPDNSVEMRVIKVSADNTVGGTALIDSGIAAGEQVVIDGQLKLRPGVIVKAAAPDPGPAAAPAPAQAPAQ